MSLFVPLLGWGPNFTEGRGKETTPSLYKSPLSLGFFFFILVNKIDGHNGLNPLFVLLDFVGVSHPIILGGPLLSKSSQQFFVIFSGDNNQKAPNFPPVTME